jgi:uncharacterized surface protein with fasciclin (FAS1) repeats
MSKLTPRLFMTACVVTAFLSPNMAHARNAELESSLRRLNDTSDFYQALVATGVAGELREDASYTVLAPTNPAFAALTKDNYPCFFQPQCHDFAVAFVRAHILEGRHPVQDIARHARMETIGKQWLRTDEPYINTYNVNGARILSEAEVGDNIIYRIDSFVVPEKDMAVFQTVSATQPAADTPAETIVTHTTTTYVAPAEDANVNFHQSDPPGANEDRTTIHNTTTTRIFEQSGDRQ